MKRRVLYFMAAALLVFSAGRAFSQQRPEILFVASESELQEALKNPDGFKGLAISDTFYRSASPENKQKIEGFVRRVLDSNTLRPAFLYGTNTDIEDAKKILGSREEAVHCAPLAMAGIFPSVFISRLSGATVEMCGSVEGERTEEWYREWILEYWLETKADLANNGYATIP